MRSLLALCLFAIGPLMTAPTVSAHCPHHIALNGTAVSGTTILVAGVHRHAEDVTEYEVVLADPVTNAPVLEASFVATDNLECELFPVVADYEAESADPEVEFHVDGHAVSSHVVATGHFEGYELTIIG